MKNYVKRILFLTIVVLSSFLLISCDEKETGNKNVGEITFTGVIDTDLEILFDSFKANGVNETYYDNRWTQLYKEELGVEVKYHWVASGWDQKLQKLSLDLVSGDIADVITFDSLDMAEAAYEDGYTMNLSDLFNEYASDLVKEQANSESSKIMMKACSTETGELFAIPGFTNLLNQSPIVYIRKDWLNNLGLKDPTSREEIINIMKAFRDNDPDQNGKKDTYGIGLTGNFVQYQGEINGYTEMFGGYPFDWITNDNDEIVYGGIQDEALDGLKFLKELYSGGYIDPEFVAKDCNALVEDIASGKVGLVFAPYWMVENALHTGWIRDKNMEWTYCPIYDEDGIATVNADSFARQYIGIRKGLENPERVIKMINLYYDVCFGENNEFSKYYMDETYPNLWHLSPIQFVDSREHGCTVYYRQCMDIINGTMKYEDADYISKMVYDIHLKVQNGATYQNGQLSLAEWKRYNYYGPNSTASILAKYEDAGSYKISHVYSPTVRTTIGSLQIDTFINIITKNVNVDGIWKNYVNSWKERGGTKQLEEYRKWYNTRYK